MQTRGPCTPTRRAASIPTVVVSTNGRRRLLVPLSVFASVGACSLTNLDGLSGGDTTGDAGLQDASGDVSRSDVSSTPADAGFCERQAPGYRICSDFDPPRGSVTESFDRGLVPVPGGAGGTFDFDTTLFVSPTRGARGVASAFAPGGTSGVRLIARLWPLGPTPSSLNCSLAWYPVSLSTVANDYAHVVQVAVYETADASKQIASLSFNMQGDGRLVFHEDYPSTA